MRGALAVGALMLAAAGAPATADVATIAGDPVGLARQAAVVVTGTLDRNARLAVDRYWKGAGPAVVVLPAWPGMAPLAGQRVAAFLEQVPGRPDAFRPLPLGAMGEVGVIAMTGDRLAHAGARLEEVMAAAHPPRDPRDRLRGAPGDDPAIRQ